MVSELLAQGAQGALSPCHRGSCEAGGVSPAQSCVVWGIIPESFHWNLFFQRVQWLCELTYLLIIFFFSLNDTEWFLWFATKSWLTLRGVVWGCSFSHLLAQH